MWRVLVSVLLLVLLVPLPCPAGEEYKLYIETQELDEKKAVKFNPSEWSGYSVTPKAWKAYQDFSNVQPYSIEGEKKGKIKNVTGYRVDGSGPIFIAKDESEPPLKKILKEFHPDKMDKMFQRLGVRLKQIELTLKVEGGTGGFTKFIVDVKGEAGLKVILESKNK